MKDEIETISARLALLSDMGASGPKPIANKAVLAIALFSKTIATGIKRCL